MTLLIAQVLALGGFVLIGVVAALTVASWRGNPSVAPSMRLAVRAGFLALDASLVTGAFMIANGVRVSRDGDIPASYVAVGTLKPIHAVTMHAILVLPALAWLLRSRWDEQRRVRAIWLAIAAYAIAAVAVAMALFAMM